jgi:hypothetical protein
VGGDDLHEAGEGSNSEQVLAYLAGVGVGELAHQQGALGRFADALDLPGQVADEGIALSVGQRDEDDYQPAVCPPARATTTEPSPWTS